MSSSFGTRLKQFRTARGWTQERVGFELEVTKATVSKWETGRAEPSLANLARIRRLYAADGLTLDYLIDDIHAAAQSRKEGRGYLREEAQQPPRMAQNQEEMTLLTRFRTSTQARRRSLLNLLEE